jgi:hypothetical protein
MSHHNGNPRGKWRMTRAGKVLLVVAAVLVLIRAVLPIGIKWYVNRTLDKNPGYDGHIEDVDLSLWRGAYVIEGVKIVKTEGKVPVPFFAAPKVDLAVSWPDLFRGSIVAKIELHSPQINFVDSKKKENQQTGAKQGWSDTVDNLVPMKINRLLVKNGEIHFRNYEAKPPVDLFMKRIEGRAENLTNSKDVRKELFATVEATGEVMNGAKFHLSSRMNPLQTKPSFDMNAKLEKLELKELNAFFNKYASLDFESGRGEIVLELTSNKGKMKGYVKPLFRNLDILNLKKDAKEGDNLFEIAWQAIAGTLADIFKNQGEDQLATKIPVEGTLDKPDTDILATLGGVLKNGFIQAFTPIFDDSVELKKKAE